MEVISYFQNGSSHLLRTNSANMLKLVAPPEPMPSDFPDYGKLNVCGRKWHLIKLAEMATGLVRFGTPGSLRGRFLADIDPKDKEDAQQLLELVVSGNPATHKCKVDMPAGTVLLAGFMTSSSTMQFFVPDTANLICRNFGLTD